MRKTLHYAMLSALVFLCPSGMGFSRTESLLHEWCGIVMFVCVLLHLVINRRWFSGLLKGKYNANRSMITVTDVLLIVLVILTVVSSMVISGYVFSFLGLSGTAWGRRIHFVGTAWLLLLCGIHFGTHISPGKRNPLLYLAGAGGVAAFAVTRFYERLFLLNEFAYVPDIPEWTVYILHALMLASFIVTGSEIKRLTARKGSKE